VGQFSVPHQWVDANLEAIRGDFARPTVHARNLFHLSICMYDAWAAYDSIAEPYLLGNGLGDYECPFEGVPQPVDKVAAQEEALSYAAYRLIRHRYTGSPGQPSTFALIDDLMADLGYNTAITTTDYQSGVPAALGNYIAQECIAAALQDGANESNAYANEQYLPVNQNIFMVLDSVGNPNITDPNRWQPISVPLFYDQSCEPFPFTPPFLSPEWGEVVPFVMTEENLEVYERDGFSWNVYHDPGRPPLYSPEGDGDTDDYLTGFEMVAIWSAHLDPFDDVMWDISPNSIGNIPLDSFPEGHSNYLDFYDLFDGGDASQGYDVNPVTGEPYEVQMIPRGDYARILAEFWADGPDSETPPGHWFKIYNEISHHPLFTWKWEGQGEALSELEYDLKTYFLLGGAMHDCAIAAWSVKGYYDYLRPVSAIRYLCDLGQRTDDQLPGYHPGGIRLYPGYIEVVLPGDTLAGEFDENVGKIKIMTWLGPEIDDSTDPCIEGANYVPVFSGVGWKLAENWWPYQRPSFVSPNFAGYVSGHSTYSRGAAEIMTRTTGDAYFPGGMSTFEAPQNDFLVFEEGPSQDVVLQWATYQDASDQCSLSRIWGGIHPPQDDIPGRKMGYAIGNDAFDYGSQYFTAGRPSVDSITTDMTIVNDMAVGGQLNIDIHFDKDMDTETAPVLEFLPSAPETIGLTASSSDWTDSDSYRITYDISDLDTLVNQIEIVVSDAANALGAPMAADTLMSLLYIDTENPTAEVSFDESDSSSRIWSLTFSESMDTTSTPLISFPVEDALDGVLSLDEMASGWSDLTTYMAVYEVNSPVELYDIDVTLNSAVDSVGNPMVEIAAVDVFSVDNRAPITSIAIDEPLIEDMLAAMGTWTYLVSYDEPMEADSVPILSFPEDDVSSTLVLDDMASEWQNDSSYNFVFEVLDADVRITDIDIEVSGGADLFGNAPEAQLSVDVLDIDTENPENIALIASGDGFNQADAGSTLELTVDFDDAMDQDVEPLLSFPVEDPSSALSFTGGIWNDEDSFTASFEIDDSGVDISDIDIQVEAATDTVGNEMVSRIMEDTLNIFQDSPEVTGTLSTDDLINDSDDGGTFSIQVDFDEAMDQNIIPLVEFVGGDVSNTLLSATSAWLDEDTYSHQFDINDVNEEILGLGILVEGAVDIHGNPAEQVELDDPLDIEMSNPVLEFLDPSVTLVDNNAVGLGGFSISIAFDEDMDQAVQPNLTFPVEDPSGNLTIDPLASEWLDATSYVFVFDVSSDINALTDIDISVTGALDIYGNPMQEFTVTDVFSIDIVTAVDEFDMGSFLQFYPNPIPEGQELMISRNTDMNQAQLDIIDPLGRVVQSMDASGTQGSTLRVLMDGLAEGTYILRLSLSEGTASSLLILTE
jgi:hypothetical protein